MNHHVHYKEYCLIFVVIYTVCQFIDIDCYISLGVSNSCGYLGRTENISHLVGCTFLEMSKCIKIFYMTLFIL